MKRRTYLSAVWTASLGALAGCSDPSTTRLMNPTVEEEDSETHLLYRDDDGRLATTTVRYGPVTDLGPIRMRLSIWHRRGTTLEDLSVTVRSRDPPGPSPEMYIAAPTASFPPIHFSRGSNGNGRRFSVPDIGEVGTGTVSIDWYLRSFDDDWPVELAFDVEYALDGGLLQAYAVDGTVDLEIEHPRVDFADE